MYKRQIRYRLSGPEKVGDAHLQPPGAFQWPQLSYDSAIADCDLCRRVRSSTLNRTVQFGWLVEDVNLTSPFSSNVANRPHSPSDVPLPRLVWVVEWQGDCWAAPPPGMRQCTTYDIIDDQNGWELDTSQFWWK